MQLSRNVKYMLQIYCNLSQQVGWIGLVRSVEWIVKEKQFKYLTIILNEVDEEDDQKTDGGTVYKQIIINAKLQIRKRGKKSRVR
jgi:hypothetical protein